MKKVHKCIRIFQITTAYLLNFVPFQGATVQLGDSGGGLMFQEKNRYYIRGIVSSKPTASWVVMFTDINIHIDWILSVRNEVEPNIIKKEITLGFKNKKQ